MSLLVSRRPATIHRMERQATTWRPPSRGRRCVPGLAALVLAAGCAGSPRPSADRPPAPAPALANARVMLLPVQAMDRAVPAGLDAELAFWLPEAGPTAEWVLPAQVERALARSPGLDADPRQLSVDAFRYAEVRRVGDPLYGELRRIASLVDAPYALLPVWARESSAVNGGLRVEIAAALVEVWTGRVLWFGVVAGAEGTGTRGRAAAALALARALRPPVPE